uniref:Uncharacterized protein n=1 Tax=Rhizophora mucronata TaxID=61149 RepID=A0A2P2MF12_RHIMU
MSMLLEVSCFGQFLVALVIKIVSLMADEGVWLMKFQPLIFKMTCVCVCVLNIQTAAFLNVGKLINDHLFHCLA